MLDKRENREATCPSVFFSLCFERMDMGRIRYIQNNLVIHISIIFALILLINIKFTALGYAILLCTIPIYFTLYKPILVNKTKNIKTILLILLKQRYLFTLLTGVLIALLIVGASSYISNTLDHNHPFYPLAGKEKVDIMSHTTPEGLINKNRIVQLYLSLFSETSNSVTDELKSKFPLRITENELNTLWPMDIRIGGFGPLFGAVIIFTIIGMAFWRDIFRERAGRIFIIIFTVIFLTVIINPEAWWARYTPQLWILPVLFLVLLAQNNRIKFKYIFICLVSLIIFTNSLLIQKANFEVINQLNKELNIQLHTLEEYSYSNEVFVDFDTFRSNNVRLEMNNIKYTEQDELSCENPIVLYSVRRNFVLLTPIYIIEFMKKIIKNYMVHRFTLIE